MILSLVATPDVTRHELVDDVRRAGVVSRDAAVRRPSRMALRRTA